EQSPADFWGRRFGDPWPLMAAALTPADRVSQDKSIPSTEETTPMLQTIMTYARIAIAPTALVVVVGLALAADAPADNKGFTASKTTAIDLGSEFSGTAGLQLRLRMLTIEPGGHIGLHNHKERPSVAYFIQGTDTVIREDGTSKTFHAGDTN